jgi:cation-transporting ATPase E
LKLKGLTQSEVNERIARGLQNISSKTKSKKIREIFIQNIFSVFNLIILSIVIYLLVFYYLLSDNRLVYDSIGVLSVAILNTLIAVIQEIRAKRALDKVNLLLKKECTIIRDGEKKSIEQSAIVVDDLIVVERGDQAAVDGKILQSNHLEIDESLLTGESHPVFKNENDTILSGSFCISGNGVFIAEKVGDNSYAAEITKLAKTFKLNISPLQKKINFIVKALFSTAIILVLLHIIFHTGKFSDIVVVRRVATVLLSLVPQGLVLMSSVTFALGIYRISKIGAIIQKLNAIESFSNVKIVCTDKTGTLTKNKLSVTKVTLLNEKFHNEVTEKLLGLYYKYSTDKNATLKTLERYQSSEDAELVDEIPFSSENKRSLIQIKNAEQNITLVFGGLDVLTKNIKDDYKNIILKEVADNGLEVYRNLVLGIETSQKSLKDLREKTDEMIIEPVCIVSISDEVRDDVMDAIKLFQDNDIQIKILSGDAAPSIQAVARKIGWAIKNDEMISGDEIESTDDNTLPDVISKKSIFARLKPEHKLRIIKSLKKQKIYNAMIGDGVNDLPAIKESDMGIAMEEGSKITKEVADIVLLKNKFALLPQIFQEGNKIVNTVNSVAKLFLTKNFMVIYLSTISLLFLFEFPLTPRRVSLFNIFSIGLPAFIIALKNVNTNKTKNFSKDLFSFVIISALIIVGASYMGQVIIERYFSFTKQDVEMVMISIMIITTISNFLAVSLRKGEKNIILYLSYAGLILGIFLFLAVTKSDFIVFRIIKEFYEISYLQPKYWGVVGFVSLLSSILLFISQKFREKLMLNIRN